MTETTKPKTTRRRTTKPKTEQAVTEQKKDTDHALKIPAALWGIMEKQGNDDFWIEEIKAILNRQYVKKSELGKRFYR